MKVVMMTVQCVFSSLFFFLDDGKHAIPTMDQYLGYIFGETAISRFCMTVSAMNCEMGDFLLR